MTFWAGAYFKDTKSQQPQAIHQNDIENVSTFQSSKEVGITTSTNREHWDY